MLKQVLVVRKDLHMRMGKIAAQVAHGSVELTLTMLYNEEHKPIVQEWLDGAHAKICVYVNNEEELTNIHSAAWNAGVPTCVITDSGHTEFHGVPTRTVVGLGPWEASEIDKITGKLKLM